MVTTDITPIKIQKSSAPRIKELDYNNITFGKLFSDHMFLADFKDGQWDDAQIIPYGPINSSVPTINGRI